MEGRDVSDGDIRQGAQDDRGRLMKIMLGGERRKQRWSKKKV